MRTVNNVLFSVMKCVKDLMSIETQCLVSDIVKLCFCDTHVKQN